MVEVRITEAAIRELEGLPKSIHLRILNLIDRLKSRPNVSGANPLRDNLAGHWRLRKGDYRLQFQAVGNTIIVERIGHRDGFYEN